MASIIKHVQRVNTAILFLNNYIDAGVVYIGIGRTSAWADENVPPLPLDNITTDDDFWTNLIGVAKVDPTDTVLTIPRNDWTSGNTYQVFDNSSVSAYSEPFYVLNSFGYVYECTGVGGGTVSDEPTGVGVINTADGYQWTYLYNLSVNDMTDILIDNWMPCYTGFEYKLGANHVMIRRLIPDPTGTSNKIGLVSYRQTAVLLNPTDVNGDPYTIEYGSAADMNAVLDPGILIQIDNRKLVARNDAQNETVVNIIQF